MTFFHLADLHIGKAVNRFPMLEDQRHIFGQILAAAKAEGPDAILIAGDVYDKPSPGRAALTLYDDFLTSLAETGIPVLIISGNHDAPEQLALAGRIIESRGIHVAGAFDGEVRRVTLTDEWGEVDFHLLPYVRPADVRPHFPDAAIDSYHSAVGAVLAACPPTPGRRNVLVAHQFVTAAGLDPERSESETEPVGGVGNVDAALFNGYDYVALGHLHGPQKMGRDAVRYAGSPLKYSFSEANQKKAITVAELDNEGKLTLRRLPLTPLHDMRKIRGPLEELTSEMILAAGDPEDYLHVTLMDEEELVEPFAKLRRVYPNLMELAFDNSRSRAEGGAVLEALPEDKSPGELFAEFYEMQNGQPMNDAQAALVQKLLEETEDAP